MIDAAIVGLGRWGQNLVTSVQGGLSSSAYSVGVLSEKEVIVHNFQNWVRERLPVATLVSRPEAGGMAALNREMVARRSH